MLRGILHMAKYNVTSYHAVLKKEIIEFGTHQSINLVDNQVNRNESFFISNV
ncbi:hypothetical protein Mapa_013699 [Marchantia paleacea]|nr:hypothetical protein Mapa_013699 [Marchantia paleacea]